MSTLPLHALLSPCFRGMRRNLGPGLVLQCIALMVALLYVYATGLRGWFDAIGEAKRAYGYCFSATSTVLFGGLIPFTILLVTGRIERRKRLFTLLFYIGFWIWKGVEVDAFYRLQAHLFGSVASVSVVAKKTLVDQFVYSPFWAAPTQTWFFLWHDSDFSLSRMRLRLTEESLGRRVLIVTFSTWVVWIPTVSIVYALPSALQMPLQSLVLCFWCLLMTTMSTREG